MTDSSISSTSPLKSTQELEAFVLEKLMSFIPTQIEPFNPTEMFIGWNNGEKFTLPYLELRFHCPCASCVDEHTGQRTIEKSKISPDIRPTQVQPVGRYAIHIAWNDAHSTGMYHFDRIYELCQKVGKKV